jgi:hypothetical protein
VWRVEEPVGVWLDDTLEWLELIQAGRARVLAAGVTLLVIQTTTVLNGREGHMYNSTLCLNLTAGELVYSIANVATPFREQKYKRIA